VVEVFEDFEFDGVTHEELRVYARGDEVRSQIEEVNLCRWWDRALPLQSDF
jgi:hypothetical protein